MPVLLPGVGSVVALEAVPLLVMVEPSAALGLTLTTSVQEAVSETTEVVFVKVIVPVPPAGTASVRVQPAGVVTETSVVLAGTASLKETMSAADGPLFLKLS